MHFSVLLRGSNAHSGYEPDTDPCSEASGYAHHALHCSWKIRELLLFHLAYGIEENWSTFESGSGSGYSWFEEYFYEYGEGWDFTDFERHLCE